jgi:multisubunit Na+/H+ antiporter MnhC subunit
MGRKQLNPVRMMLACGMLSSLLYAGIDIVGALSWPGYDPRSQAISELSAIGAPTAELIAPLQTLYNILLVTFGGGVWLVAEDRRTLRWCGGLIIALASLGIGWALFPMYLRGAERGLADSMHLVMGAVSITLILTAIVMGAAASGSRFRLYSAATVLVTLTFGYLTALDVPRIEAGLPTRWLGVNERIMMASWQL